MDARMTDARARTLLRALPEQGHYTLRIKFLRERGPGEWVMEDKIDPVREGQTRGRQVITITRKYRFPQSFQGSMGGRRPDSPEMTGGKCFSHALASRFTPLTKKKRVRMESLPARSL